MAHAALAVQCFDAEAEAEAGLRPLWCELRLEHFRQRLGLEQRLPAVHDHAPEFAEVENGGIEAPSRGHAEREGRGSKLAAMIGPHLGVRQSTLDGGSRDEAALFHLERGQRRCTYRLIKGLPLHVLQ